MTFLIYAVLQDEQRYCLFVAALFRRFAIERRQFDKGAFYA